VASSGDKLSLLIQHTGGVHKWLNLESRCVFAVCRSVDGNEAIGGNEKGVYVEGTVGRWRVDVAQLAEIADRLQPDVLLAPSDEAAALPEVASYSRARKATSRTLKYLDQLVEAVPKQVRIFAALEGGQEDTVRKECAESIGKYAGALSGVWLSGLGLGEDSESRKRLGLASLSCSKLQGLPVLVQGVSSLREFADWIDLGVDLFDSAYALMCTELGCALDAHSLDKIDYRDARWSRDGSVGFSDGCGCSSCSGGYRKAYLHHLLNTNEMLGKILLQVHNVWILEQWLSSARAAIERGEWAHYRRNI
jgi:queuine tRNA-ribosyltransferase